MGVIATARRRWLVPAALSAWFGVMVLVGAALMARHLVPLPVAEASEASGARLAELRGDGGEGAWTVVHVLYTECRCSDRIVDHLTSTERPEGAVERVLLVGDGEQGARLVAAGFEVVPTSARRLSESFGIEAGPLLVVLDTDDRIRYAGGYTARKQSLEVKDVEIVEHLQAGASPEELPLYGCPVSQGLQAQLNPLGI